MDVLVIDDDRAFREGMSALLKAEGYVVRTARNGALGLAEIAKARPDLVLLDVMMPDMNGYGVCREIRRLDQSLPVLFLTAKDEEGDELRGFGVGADDYLSKSSPESILIARIAAMLRRTATMRPAEGFAIARGFVDTARQKMSIDDTEFQLSLREIEVLRWFSLHPGEVFSIDWMLTHFWGVDAELAPASVHMMISRLREKLGADGRRLMCVRNQGYVYNAN